MKRLLVSSVVAVLCAISFLAIGCWEDVFCPVNEPPSVVITKPPPSGGFQTLPRMIIFEWETATSRNPRSIRYFVSQNIDTSGIYDPHFDFIRDLNMNPSRYEDWWSEWISWYAEGDSGRTTVIGDDEELVMNRHHVFVVQAKDWCGRVTEVFERNVNVRNFIVARIAGPNLMVSEPFLGYSRFLGTNMSPVQYDVPTQLPLNFTWWADASSYGGEIACYRYGWDIQDLDNPDDWDVTCDPVHTSAPTRTWYSGVHTLTIEAVDNIGMVTRAHIQVEILPFPMSRNLLWVDDFYATDPQPPNYYHPGETNHDSFWYGICSMAEGWDQARDVYDCMEYNLTPPDIREIGRYKNIIWTYSSAYNAWADVVRFIPESQVGCCANRPPNYLPMFLAVGGHLWTSGRADRAGGMAGMLQRQAQSFPMSLKCEITGNQEGCSGDASGVNSMGYKDYCITMLDKISAVFRTDDDMPYRYISHYDAMNYGWKDDNDPVTQTYPELPDRLVLWSEVTKPGRFFAPDNPPPYPGGLTYLEIYDPQYWMERNFVTSQSCFHPMYRMRTLNFRSCLNDQAIALWITRYDDIVPEVQSGAAVAAKSFHFGFPLWFFDRDGVDAIAGVVFDEWEIRAE